MKLLLLGCFLTIWINNAVSQMGFTVKIEKIDIVYFNPDFIKDPVCIVFQYNATHQAINASGYLLQDLGMELKDDIEVYAVEDDGEHLLTTAKDVNVCEILTSGFPELEELFKIGNFSKCPMQKNFYVMPNAIVDVRNIPPSVPRGRFLIDIKSYNGTTLLVHSKSYDLVEDAPEGSKK